MSGTSPTDPHGSQNPYGTDPYGCLLYTSDAADE